MEEQKKSRKPLLVGVIAAVVVLAVLLALLLTQCVGGTVPSDTSSAETTTAPVAQGYDLYWNVDRNNFKAVNGLSTTGRKPADDGYYHMVFAHDGKQVELRVKERRLVNIIDGYDLIHLVFDENGDVIDIIRLDDLPLQKMTWQYYIQSFGGNVIKMNSSKDMNGMEEMIETADDVVICDVSGWSEFIGAPGKLQRNDRAYVIANEEGLVTHIYLYERDGIEKTILAECKHCGKEVTWQNWMKKESLPITDGHYFLEHDVESKKQHQIPANKKICLDLNGYTIHSSSTYRIYATFDVGSGLALMDNSQGTPGKIVVEGKNMDQGGAVWARYGNVDIYDITIDASGATTHAGGAAVCVEGGVNMTLHSGTLIGGKCVKVDGKGALRGGTVRVGADSKFIMNGGLITGGESNGMGGNVYVSARATFEMNGGKITNGRVKGTNGGNVAVMKDGSFVMNGGTISGGRAYRSDKNANGAGANVYINGKFTMNSGTITGGRCYKYDGTLVENWANQNFFIVNGDLYMYGGRIAGYVQAADTNANDNDKCIVYVSGGARISGAAEGSANLTLGKTVSFQAGKLSGKAEIYVTASGIFSEKTRESNINYVHSDDPAVSVVYYEECLALGRVQCICGASLTEGKAHAGPCDGTLEFFGPYSTGIDKKASGNYYLTKDYENLSQHNFGTSNKKDENGNTILADPITINLDLNGHSMHAAQRMMLVNGNVTLNITDSVGGGVISGKGVTDASNAGVVLTSAGSTVNVLGDVTFKAGEMFENMTSGGVFATSGTLNMYHGTIEGAKGLKTGGAVRIYSSAVNMYNDSKIIGGSVTQNGGAVYMNANSTLTMSGDSKIIDGEVTGVATDDTHGGNIFMNKGATLIMKDNASISGGSALNTFTYIENDKEKQRSAFGGNIYSQGIIEMHDNASITGGLSEGKSADKEVTSKGLNSNLFLVGSKASVKLYGGYLDSLYITSSIGEFIVGGNARVDSLTLASGKIINIDGVLADEAKIVLVAPSGGAFTGETVAENADNFSSSDGQEIAFYAKDKKLYVGGEPVDYNPVHCVCGAAVGDVDTNSVDHANGCDKKIETWEPYTGTFETTGNKNYYLTSSMTGQSTKTLGANQTVKIDLNGYNYIATDRAFRATSENNVLWICNTAAEKEGRGIVSGKTTYWNDKPTQGGVIWANKGEVNLIGNVTLTPTADQIDFSHGGVVCLEGTASFNMYSGKIVGGPATGTNGGAVALRGTSTFIMEGGRIVGSSATNGGAVYVGETAKFTMKNGEIVGGNATQSGGGVYAVSGAKVNISGNAQITGNVGSNLYLEDGALVNVGTMGENANVGVTLETTTGIFSSNRVAVTTGFSSDNTQYAVERHEGKLAIMTAGTGSGGATTPEPGPYNTLHCVCGAAVGDVDTNSVEHANGCDKKIETWEEYTGTFAATGNINYYLTADLTDFGVQNLTSSRIVKIDLNGYNITATSRAFRVNHSDAILWICNTAPEEEGRGIVSGRCATSTKFGGVIRLDYGELNLIGNVTLKLADDPNPIEFGGIVSNLAGTTADFNMYDGKIIGGTVSGNGGAIAFEGNGTFTMEGGTISGGSAAKGGAVYLGANAKFTMENGEITGGSANSEDNDIYIDGAKGGGKLIMSGDATVGYVNCASDDNNISVEVKDSAKIRGLTTGGVMTPTVTGALTKDALIRITDITEAGATLATITAEGLTEAQKALAASRIQGSTSIGGYVDGTDIKLSGSIINHCVCGAAVGEVREDTEAAHDDGCDKKVVAWEKYTGTISGSGNYYLTENLTNQACVTLSANQTVYIDLNGYNLHATERAFFLNAAGETLWICNTAPAFEGTGIISGRGVAGSGTNAGVISLNVGEEFRLFKNVTIELADNQNTVTRGGTVYARNINYVNMYGGKIIGGKVKNYGGAVDVRSADTYTIFTMYGGEIIGGEAAQGGAVYVDNGKATFIVQGGTITGGQTLVNGVATTDESSNIYISTGNLNLEGGVVDGNILVNGGAVTVSGNAKVKANAVTGKGLTLANDILLNLGTVGDQASVVVGKVVDTAIIVRPAGMPDNEWEAFNGLTNKLVAEAGLALSFEADGIYVRANAN